MLPHSHFTRIIGAVIIAGAIAGGGVYRAEQSPPVGGGPGTANFWVDTNGGSCSRSPSAVSYLNNGSECANLNAAFQLAHCGDTIEVRPGDYQTSGNGGHGEQQVNDNPTITACGSRPNGVKMTAESGNQFGLIDNLADYVTYDGFKVRGVGLLQSGTDVTVQNFDGGSFFVASPNAIIQTSDWGPCETRAAPVGGLDAGCTADDGVVGAYINNVVSDALEGKNKILDGADNLLLYKNTIHDYIQDTINDHFECIWVNGGNNVTIDSNKFYNCQTSGVSLGNGGDSFTNSPPPSGLWLFQNNLCSNSLNKDCVKLGQFSFRAFNGTYRMIVRFNTFVGGDLVKNEEGTEAGYSPPHNPISGEFYVLGNIFDNDETQYCSATIIYDYNFFAADPVNGGNQFHSGCGTHTYGLTVGNLKGLSDVIVDGAALPGGDQHLKGAAGSTIIDNQVPTSVQFTDLDHDYAGNPRPHDTNRDIGAYER